ncbi:hypothetical protein DBR06_SOUSAS14210007, partial [Sousa chinensis]
MKRTDSGSCCRRRCDCGRCCRASSRARHAPYWSRDTARTPQSSRQSPGRERRHPEPSGSWAAAAEEEEAAAAAAPWMSLACWLDDAQQDEPHLNPVTSVALAWKTR